MSPPVLVISVCVTNYPKTVQLQTMSISYGLPLVRVSDLSVASMDGSDLSYLLAGLQSVSSEGLIRAGESIFKLTHMAVGRRLQFLAMWAFLVGLLMAWQLASFRVRGLRE